MNNIRNVIEKFRYIDISSRDNAINEISCYFCVKDILNKRIEECKSKDIFDALKNIGKELSDNRIDVYYDIYKTLDLLGYKEILQIIDEISKFEYKTSGITIFPNEVFNSMFNVIGKNNKILLVDIEKYGSFIYDFINNNQNQIFYLSCEYEKNIEFYKKVLNFENINFLTKKVYDDNFINEKFDYIICFPPFGFKIKEINKNRISNDVSLVYAQNLLYYLKDSGVLRIILPSKIGFAGDDIEEFRTFVNNNYKISKVYLLTSNVFKPYMMINTYYMEFSTGKTENIELKKIDRNKNGELIEIIDKLVFKEEFEELTDWNVENLISQKSNEMLKYENSSIKKETLNIVASVLKGKTITKKDNDGNIKVINIANINDGEIDYNNLDGIKDDIIKNSRYILNDGDILISARGTVIKIAIFNKQDFACIASSNLNVIRCNKEIMNSTYLKLFLESSVGKELINSIRRGSIILNINNKDLELLKVPVPTAEEQKKIINEYERGKESYKRALNEAEEAWNKIKNSIENQLY